MRTRWAHVGIRVFVDNEELDHYKAVSLSFDELVEADKARYQGDTGPRLDAEYNGGTGSMDFRLEHGFGDPTDAYERYVAGIKNLDGTGRIDIQASRVHPKTKQRESRRFENCQIRQSERGGENGPYAITWNFDYEDSKRT